ncbi:GNAT family N-acetyltransferase [Halobaculum lipolyticum]|uniref:GNAT family N-acetyltransferase n=1 Tax=Halobaculum lipolyticum TaxID=3032001 RepID=A0ABD5WEZ4_9EURY|nr:GNAT family N-acetyltransferase [Halobaculum sp. DT31]
MRHDTLHTTADGPAVEQCADSDAWDAFVERADGPPFALWGWGEAAGVYGHRCRRLAVVEDGDIVAGLPLVHVRSRLFGSKLVSPPFGERASIVSADDADGAAERALLERTRSLADDLGVDFVSLRGRALPDAPGFEARRRFVTFRIPVADEPSMREAMKDSRERQIRQAADDPDLVYEEGTDLDALRDYYDLYLRSVRGHGTPPHSFDFYRSVWERYRDAGRLHLGLVRRDGEAINGIINLACGSTATQWGVVTDYEHRDLNGGSYLVWQSLRWAAERGLDAYELGRTREGSGVYMFKRSFGGEKTWYDDRHYFPSGDGDLPDPEDDRYDRLKDVWRRVPVPVTRVVGPKLRQSVTL